MGQEGRAPARRLHDELIALGTQYEEIGRALVAAARSEYPKGCWIRARLQTNHPQQVVRVIDADEKRPGILKIRHASGFESSVHLRNVEGRA